MNDELSYPNEPAGGEEAAPAAAPASAPPVVSYIMPPAGRTLTRHQRKMIEKAAKAAAAAQAALDDMTAPTEEELAASVVLPSLDRNNLTDLQRAVLTKIESHHSIRKCGEACGVDYTYLWRLAKGVHTNPSNEVLSKLGLLHMSTDGRIAAAQQRIMMLEQLLRDNGIEFPEAAVTPVAAE